MSDAKAQIMEIARHKGVVRPRDLRRLGLHQEFLSQLVESGQIVRTGRGLYMLAGFDVTERHTLVEAVQVQKNGIVCLLSALNYHGLGTQLPHEVWLSIPLGTWKSTNSDVPITTVVMRSPSYDAGIDVHEIEGVKVPIYNIPKTIADCFKFRSKVGFDVALEALREALNGKRCSSENIRKYAKLNRVDTIMRPYMEALV